MLFYFELFIMSSGSYRFLYSMFIVYYVVVRIRCGLFVDLVGVLEWCGNLGLINCDILCFFMFEV